MGWITGDLASAGGCSESSMGLPIRFREDYSVTAGDDTAATPLVPSAAPAGVMSGLQVVNKTCNDLTVSVEYYSKNNDCDKCTTDVPTTTIVKETVKAGEALSFSGLWVDYAIDGGEISQNGEILVFGDRVTSTCSTLELPGKTQINELTIPAV